MYDDVYQQNGIVRGRPAKIQGLHVDRLAVVYVRQSTLQQVAHHQESTRLQYALRECALQWGWSPQRVLVIDEDQGQSGKDAVGRVGFQRLVAEVGLNHVGLILGRELSRLARSNSDWYQLLDMCAVFQTLIADVDGIYDPCNYNDRLVLGLQGTMAEAELHLLKQRMNAGRWAKARRGELWIPVPMGYIHRPSGEVIKDPDEQAQAVIELVFRTFERCGTISGVLRYCIAHGIELPVRERCGPDTGTLRWVRANRSSISLLLHHPMYAGAYVYGRRRVDPSKQRPGHPGSGQVLVPMEEWGVCLKDRFPAYIRWERYEQNLRQMAANAPHHGGVPRNGSSLLAGLVYCGRCGRRMTTQYSTNGGGLTLSVWCATEAVWRGRLPIPVRAAGG